MHLELGFGNPWYLTTVSTNTRGTLYSRGSHAQGSIRSIFLRVSLLRWSFTVGAYPPGITPIWPRRFRLIIGIVFTNPI